MLTSPKSICISKSSLKPLYTSETSLKHLYISETSINPLTSQKRHSSPFTSRKHYSSSYTSRKYHSRLFFLKNITQASSHLRNITQVPFTSLTISWCPGSSDKYQQDHAFYNRVIFWYCPGEQLLLIALILFVWTITIHCINIVLVNSYYALHYYYSYELLLFIAVLSLLNVLTLMQLVSSWKLHSKTVDIRVQYISTHQTATQEHEDIRWDKMMLRMLMNRNEKASAEFHLCNYLRDK